MKKAISVLALFALLLLTACSKSNDIKNGKVKSVKVSVVSTSHDNSSFFTLIPIVVSTGKTTTITYIPVWNDIRYLTVEYTYEKKIYKTKTDDFYVEEYKGKPYIKIAKSDIGKKKASLVLYTHDK
ncbi:hypothetical protein KB529_02795 [Lactococcus lactis subsp. lactis]|jgi:major membrane immunogen (membrane-anchored lipoprotein)|uniref:hypothetical protein n=1 Tax=Lactococcus lactis TaxID=1358 RepID=UPI001BAA6DA9|nr:hypothetical protein [Lactococcus lactis]MDT3324854.1 hypothetical protein [Bacillota bacterium]MBR8678315.1 hypothetical protein [Lactococcus lactis subsp. lactis]MBR8681256.1 hypothetical protein [Lactococcus lactis subsp. lactis]MBR8686380.1 hypothetical protein [Lactococcus lactis subsp. lactis]MBS3729476.1 hypothetical protein [Lactococcus lactis subsp. lactis]